MDPKKISPPPPKDRLFQKMSEVISLREKVAQAKLALLPPEQPGPEK
jgi:hypothetical protein